MVAPDEAGDLSRSLVRVPGSGFDRTADPVTCDLGRVSSLAATVPVNPRLPPIITHPRKTVSLPSLTSETKASVAKLGSQSSGPVRQARIRLSPQPYTPPLKRPLVQASMNPTSAPTQAPSNTPSHTANTTPSPTSHPTPTRQTVELPAGFMANKRARITYLTPQQAVHYAPNILYVNTHDGPALLMPVQPEGNKPHGTRPLLQARPTRQQDNAEQLQARPTRQQDNAELQITTEQQQAATGNQGSGLTVMTLEQLMRQQSNLREENAALQQQVTIFQQLFQNPARLEAVVRQLGIRVDTN